MNPTLADKTGPLAYLNGQFVPADDISLAVNDLGFVWGAAISERMRTFGGELFRLDDHLRRLARSLKVIGIGSAVDAAALAPVARELAAHNHRQLDEGDDLGMTLFVTPGITSADSPTVCLHTARLPFHNWVDDYRVGQKMFVTDIRQVPASCWPAELKCRSRIHYYLADRQATTLQTGARALLLDLDEFVTESSTANLVLYRASEGFISPPLEKILHGISLSVLTELAAAAGIAFHYRDITVDDVFAADEALLCSTSPCLWSVVELNGRALGNGKPGPVFTQFLSAWSDLVGIDIAKQTRTFAHRG